MLNVKFEEELATQLKAKDIVDRFSAPAPPIKERFVSE